MRVFLLLILSAFCLGFEGPLCGTSVPEGQIEMDGSIYSVLVKGGRQFYFHASFAAPEWVLFGRSFHVDCRDPFSQQLRPQLKMKPSMVRHLRRVLKDESSILKVQGLTTSPSQEYDEVLDIEADLQLDASSRLISLQIKDRDSNECLLCAKQDEILDVRRL